MENWKPRHINKRIQKYPHMLILFKKCPCLCSPLHTRHSLCHPRGLPNKPLCPNCSFLNPFFVTRPIIARFILNLNQLHKFLTFLSEILGFIHIRLPTYSSASNLMMPGSKGLSPHELAHRLAKDLRTRPDMSIKVG